MYKFIDKILIRKGRMTSSIKVSSQKNTTLSVEDKSEKSSKNGFIAYLQEYEDDWDLSLEENVIDNI